MIELKETDTTLSFTVLAVPRSSKDMMAGCHDNALKIKLAAPPVDGKANQACLRFLARNLHVPLSDIDIISGHNARRKNIRICFPADPDGKQSLQRVRRQLQAY